MRNKLVHHTQVARGAGLLIPEMDNYSAAADKECPAEKSIDRGAAHIQCDKARGHKAGIGEERVAEIGVKRVEVAQMSELDSLAGFVKKLKGNLLKQMACCSMVKPVKERRKNSLERRTFVWTPDFAGIFLVDVIV